MGAVTGEALECGDAGVLFGEEGIAGLRSGGGFGRREQVGFDTNVKCIDLLQSGAVSALIVQNPYAMGYLGVEAVCNLLDGQTYRTAELLDTATRTVTKETMFTIENQKALFSFG